MVECHRKQDVFIVVVYVCAHDFALVDDGCLVPELAAAGGLQFAGPFVEEFCAFGSVVIVEADA